MTSCRRGRPMDRRSRTSARAASLCSTCRRRRRARSRRARTSSSAISSGCGDAAGRPGHARWCLPVILIGGSNFVAVRFSNAELPPYWGAAIRFLPASLVLFVVMAIGRIPVPYGSALVGAVLWGLINFGLGYALTYFGLQQVNAGTASVILA